MRVFFPIALVLGVALMLAMSLASLAISLVLPFVLLIAGVGCIASLRAIALGFQLIRLGFGSLGLSLGYLRDVIEMIFIWPEAERELTDSPTPQHLARLKSLQFPELHRLQTEVAGLLGKKPVDEVWLSPDTALGIGTALDDGKRIRFMVVGLELVRVLSPEQLRSALLHEFGHEKGGDLWLGRWSRRLLHRLNDAVNQFAIYNPAFWAAALSLLVVKVTYLPWSRAKEYAADRWSVRFAGPTVAAEALRVVKRETPTVEAAMTLVLIEAVRRKVVPPRLCEAVRYAAARIPPVERHRLGVRAEGDPLELGGRTHPTIPLRILAMSKAPAVAPVTVPRFDPARLATLDEQCTRQWLEGFGKTVSLEEFFAPPKEPPRAIAAGASVNMAGEGAPSGEAAQSDDAPLELDHGRDWWRDKKE